MKDLILPLKKEFFEAIAAGTKQEEFRLCNKFWAARLEGKRFDRVVLTLGYPPAWDDSKRLVRVWRGYTTKSITHPLFGLAAVTVYAIDVSSPWPAKIKGPNQ